jgi:hypothetical protein
MKYKIYYWPGIQGRGEFGWHSKIPVPTTPMLRARKRA